jgi:phospholipid-binding lipoprotein MlaA
MRRFLALAVLAIASGCATVSGPPNPRDPWEGYNRSMHAFNESVDHAVLKPVAIAYEAAVPDFARDAVANFFGNINDAGTGLNNLLQGKVEEAVSDMGRVLMNTSFGLGGLIDIASAGGIEKHNEDFGQTLGWWGVPSGPYFIIPFLGPSTLRDAPARYVDPMFYNRWIDPVGLRYGLAALDVVRVRAALLKGEKVLEEAALDKYSFTRDAWLQRRRNQVYDGSPPKVPDEDE